MKNKKFLIMIILHSLVMFILMYAMIDTFDHFYFNINKVYMALLMTSPMIIIEVLLMGSMYGNRKFVGSVGLLGLLVGIGTFLLIRTQTFIGDTQFLKAMIPHHSSAILMCEEANITDSDIKRLCDQIVKTQKDEIDIMKKLLNDKPVELSESKGVEETVKESTNYNWSQYSYPDGTYTMEYPKSWDMKTVREGTTKFTSPDFEMSQGYPVLLEGAQVYVFVEETTEISAQSSFNNDPLASDIAKNVITTKLSGVDAIEYDISFEGTVATVTKAVKDGVLYTVQFRYPGVEDKQTYNDVRANILNSFEIK